MTLTIPNAGSPMYIARFNAITESPIFKEIVKAGLTPMISTLSIMETAETESEVLGLGLSVIALNIGMYIGLPAFGIVKVIQFRKN